MNVIMRTSLSVTIFLSLCLSLAFLSPDLSIFAVPAGVVGLFLVNIDPILQMALGATERDESTE